MWRSDIAPRLALGLGSVFLFASACSPELEKLKQERSERGSLGQEVYKTVCRRVAGTELPGDVDGRESDDLCLGDAEAAQQALDDGDDELPARLLALAKRRDQIVEAIDTLLPDEVGGELELLMRELLPFYEDDRIQNSTRTLAAFLEVLAKDEDALGGLERLGREGMIAPEHNFGAYRAMLGYKDLSKVLRVVLPILTEDKQVKQHLETVVAGLALELATSEFEDEPDSDTRVLKDLLTREHPDFAEGEPLYTSLRDDRGLPIPEPVGGNPVPYPFIDGNSDGLADEKGGKVVMSAAYKEELPEPFATRGEPSTTRRDEYGRALGYAERKPSDEPLYSTQDSDRTVLAGLLRESGKVFAEDTQIAKRLAKVFPVMFGERVKQSRAYGKTELAYRGPDVDDSPALDLVHTLSVLVDRPVYDESLELTKRLLEEHEKEWARSVAPLLTLEKRTRKDSDAYPNAKLTENSIFWDELLYESELLSRQRKTKDSESVVEAMLRGQLGYVRDGQGGLERVDNFEALRHLGAVAATMMRFKDEWRGNPRSESKRGPGEEATRGVFRTPVDREAGDTPVTCGRDGCGGQIKGSPFEDWAADGQICMAQRRGRPGTDCGQPPNQSLYQRSLGLVWEMAGRSQQNKVITIRNLLEFALPDPCENLNTVTTCATDAECAPLGSPDYVCDTARTQCVAKKGTQTCNKLRADDKASREPSIGAAATSAIADYSCDANSPADACHAYEVSFPGAFIDPDGAGPVEAGIQVGHLMDLPDVGRVFGRALTHEYAIEIPNPWVRRYLDEVAKAASLPECASGTKIADPAAPYTCVQGTAADSRAVYGNMSDDVDTLGELMEFLLDDSSLFQGDVDTAALRPDVKALSRVLFAPTGGTSSLLFDPILVRNAPAVCTAAQVQQNLACPADDTAAEPAGCCIGAVNDPPLRYRLETYYGATTFAWEYPIKFSDGMELSFIDSMIGVADAINRTDYDPTNPEEAGFETKEYAFTVVGEIIAKHYDSPKNTSAQNTDPNGPNFRYLTNLVSYEPLLADAADDGMVEDPRVDSSKFDSANQQLGILYNTFDVLEILDTLDFGGGRDGIDVAADLTEHALSAHAGCAGDTGDGRVIEGKGPCDRALEGASGVRDPITYRDGRQTVCWNDGRCFDGKEEARHFVSPAYIAIDALSEIDDRIVADPDIDQAFNDAMSAIIDSYAQIEDDKLVDRRLRALLIVGSEFMRDRIASEQEAGTLDELGEELMGDAVDIVQNPVFAGGLDMLQAMLEHEEALDELTRFSFALLDDSADQKNLRDLLAAAADLVQSLPGDGGTTALLRVLGATMIPNVGKLVEKGGELDAAEAVESGMLWQNMTLSRDTVEKDKEDVLPVVLQHLVESSEEQPYTPLETIVDAVMAINRRDPNETGVLSARDWGNVASRLAEVMLDERRGFERLYQLVQCRDRPATNECR
jgi:hypothetical protein